MGQGLGQRLEGLDLGEEDEEAQQQLEAFLGHLQVIVCVCVCVRAGTTGVWDAWFVKFGRYVQHSPGCAWTHF